MSTVETPVNFFGVLLAGSTPEVNEVQIHQDKLGEYTRTGGTLHGRPAYKKDNNVRRRARAPRRAGSAELSAELARARPQTNHMLWFCFASDGTPTWYVGKEEEFGQARGWLQVCAQIAARVGRAWCPRAPGLVKREQQCRLAARPTGQVRCADAARDQGPVVGVVCD
jgi:hypothetical protein